MKNPFKKTGKALQSKTKKDSAIATRADVNNFLQQVASVSERNKRDSTTSRLIFALDATASRQSTWDRASQLQKEMFISTQSMGGLQLQLAYFRGFNEFYASSWQNDAEMLVSLMPGLRCAAGMTQIEKLLRHGIRQNQKEKIRGIIYIGDAMEENADILCGLAGELGILNVPLFIFQEHNDAQVRQTFSTMARLSGGAYCHFDDASVDQLKDLLRAVAIYATGGLQALQDFSRAAHPSVKLLGTQLK